MKGSVIASLRNKETGKIAGVLRDTKSANYRMEIIYFRLRLKYQSAQRTGDFLTFLKCFKI